MRGYLAIWAVVAACGNGGGSGVDATGDPLADGIGLSILDAYGKAWGEGDAAARKRLLEYSAVDTLTVYEPTRTLASRDAVDAAIVEFLAGTPGGSVVLVGNIREAHERVWLRWDTRNGSGTSIAAGVDLMKRGPDQRLERVHSFFGSLPTTVGTHTPVQQALIDAWNQPNGSMRNALLATAVTDDVVFAIESESVIISGRATLSAIIGTKLSAEPGRVLSVTSGYLDLPKAFHVAWKVDGTTGPPSGVMMGLLADDGRIAEAVYFDGAEP
ncbi:MAG TPA: hypothetical protein VIV11_03510 [Kofleriaceae bacterium]